MSIGYIVWIPNHIVTIYGVKMDPTMVDAVNNCSIPTNVGEVMSFLGLAD